MIFPSRPKMKTRVIGRDIGPLLILILLCSASPLRAVHSDIILSRVNGALQVDNEVHEGDVRENDAAGNGTVWATDNPGFAGSGFHFNDEILFDITGPLKRWDGTNWTSANIGGEFMNFVEPGPFGDAIHHIEDGMTILRDGARPRRR